MATFQRHELIGGVTIKPCEAANSQYRAYLHTGPPSSSQGALALSGEQMRCVYANAPKDRARTDLRIRLALGAEIPRSVELFPFPDEALACAPELANYTYIVVQDDVVIVEPTAYAVVQVISD